MRGDSLAILLSTTSPLPMAPMEEDMFDDLLCDEPMGLNPCSDSIDDFLMMREAMQLVPRASQLSVIVQPPIRALLGKKNNGFGVRRCAICSKKIHIGQGTH